MLIAKLYRDFFVTTLLNMFLRVSVSSIGVFFAGNMLGSDALATAGLLFPIILFYVALASWLEYGCVTTVSRHIGENDYNGAKKSITVSYTASLIISLLMALIGLLFLDTILNLLQIPADMLAEARAYVLISLIGGLFFPTIAMGIALVKFENRPVVITLVSAISPVCTIILTYILIQYAGMGLRAVALGMNAGYALTALGMAIIVARSEILGFAKVKLAEVGKIVTSVVKSGSFAVLTELAGALVVVITNGLIISQYGQLALSAHGTLLSLNSLLLMIASGSASASVQLVGVMNAEHDSSGVKQLIKTSLKYGLSLALVTAAVLIIFSRPIADSHGMGSVEAFSLMFPVLVTLALKKLLDVISNTLTVVYNTIGRSMASTVIAMCRKFFFPLALLFALSSVFGLSGVWVSIWLSPALAVVVSLVYSFIASSRNKYLGKVFLIDTEAVENGSFVSFSVENSINAISDRSAGIASFCEQNKLDKSRSYLIALAIEEMLLLIRQFCLKDNNEIVDLRVLIFKDEVVLRLRNGGAMFNPLAFYRENNPGSMLTIDDALENKEFIGLKMVVDTVKSIDYRRTFGVNNLTITIGSQVPGISRVSREPSL